MAKRQTAQPTIHPSSFKFLDTLAQNNNREWFNAHKDLYLEELQRIETFADALLATLHTHDLIETPSGKKSLHRIYRDTRFSHNKTPYKINWSGAFKRATRQRRGGYYFHIEPGNTFIAGGFWGPVPQDLKRVRDDIAFDPSPLRKILKSKTFINTFGTLKGEQLKTTPKGYDATHEAVDLLRYKQFLLIRRFSDDEVLSQHFLEEAGRTFKNMRPFFDYMSDVLTTGPNGEEA
ncbi:DUF2461 domain-containing protein [Chitinophaga pendula]|uniref:DUF2461 domain-containing protein n=1 Tax=Chitinophaga TaxID=79328 RepID=UPI000BB08E57|nr:MULTISPECIES: DUF2461 domain-containing protein [Chitinophaga]ASZ12636.1 TIGR02453 family protein [Chitinophaga sp. MD30]UCJ09754.1 DUF2461 domain-containing protein [Chitinophaga pendula]